MKKIRLDLDDLSIDTFETGTSGILGTVNGHDTGSPECTPDLSYSMCRFEECLPPSDTATYEATCLTCRYDDRTCVDTCSYCP